MKNPDTKLDTENRRPLAPWSALVLALPLVALAACGSSGGDSGAPPAQPADALWDQFDWDADTWS